MNESTRLFLAQLRTSIAEADKGNKFCSAPVVAAIVNALVVVIEEQDDEITKLQMPVDARELAQRFHDTYERLAPSFGYKTRDDTKTFDPDSPNGKLMIAVCAAIEEERTG